MEAGNLRPNQRKAIEALLAAPSMTAAASLAGCGERTLWRWMHDPGFKAALAEAQREQRRAVSTALRRAGLAAVDTLVAVLGDGTAPTGAKVSAAKAVLELVYRDVADDLEARLGDIESRLEARPEGR